MLTQPSGAVISCNLYSFITSSGMSDNFILAYSGCINRVMKIGHVGICKQLARITAKTVQGNDEHVQVKTPRTHLISPQGPQQAQGHHRPDKARRGFVPIARPKSITSWRGVLSLRQMGQGILQIGLARRALEGARRVSPQSNGNGVELKLIK